MGAYCAAVASLSLSINHEMARGDFLNVGYPLPPVLAALKTRAAFSADGHSALLEYVERDTEIDFKKTTQPAYLDKRFAQRGRIAVLQRELEVVVGDGEAIEHLLHSPREGRTEHETSTRKAKH